MIKIGVLGGGQLAQMMCEEGQKLGFDMHVLSKSKEDPAAQIAHHWHQGDVENQKSLINFFKQVDVITIESEFLDHKLLKKASTATKVHVYPQPANLNLFSDRLSQKRWLKKNTLPTASFIQIKNQKNLIQFFQKNNKIVIKQRRFGYDGYGTFIIKNKNELTNWIQLNKNKLDEFIAEAFIPFQKELAIQITRSRNGDVLTFPLVEWQAENAKCLWVKGPITNRNVATKSHKHLDVQIARTIKKIILSLKKINYVGTIAFEFFYSTSELLINEVAPRVHNSGHHTLESCSPNQFSAHLLAILSRPLAKKPRLNTKAFAMLNLIGHKSKIRNKMQAKKYFTHWYGKTECREGRKMGHVTVLANSPDQALKELLKYY